jgi:glutamate carboxypeptidase
MTLLHEIIAHTDLHKREMFRCLSDMVWIQSGSHNKAGVDRMGAYIRSSLAGYRLLVEIAPQTEFGDHLILRSECCNKARTRQILLVGHMDTVFPTDSDFTGYTEDDQRCYGPGVIDMKGGLVVGLFALKVLDALRILKDLPVTFILNSDEEVGSPSSRELIGSEAVKSAFAFVLEAGGLKGEIVIGRKGNALVGFNIEGVPGHAAFTGNEKASAVLELAHKIIALESLNDSDAGISVNAGKIWGGIGHNTVAAHASALIDFRFIRYDQLDFLIHEIERIVHTSIVPHTKTQYEIRSQRNPMPTSQATINLFQLFEEIGKSLKIPIDKEFRFGVSDANTIAAAGTPVLDGLGPLGADDHSEREYMIKTSLVQRTQLLALGILECWKRHLQGNFP